MPTDTKSRLASKPSILHTNLEVVMKKKIITSVIALILATVFGISAELLTPKVEAVYCKLVPEDCK
nr:MAG: hypothetical protein [Microvirus sp.]